jgi:hypothetical protein
MNKLRARTASVISDLEGALEILRNIERSLDEVPCDLDAESIDLDVIAAAVRGADDEGVEHIHVRLLQDEVNRIRDGLSEAVGQVEYLESGDFDQ